MTRGKKLTLVGIILMVMVSVLGLLLVVPWGIEAYMVWQLERMTGQRIVLDEVSVHYLDRTIYLEGLQVVEPDLNRPVVTLDRIQVSFRLWPLFRKQISLPRVALEQPVLSMVRAEDGQLNVRQLFPEGHEDPEEPEDSQKSQWHIIVEEFTIHNGRITYQDETYPSRPRAHIDRITLHLSDFSTQPMASIPVALQAALGEQGRVTATGRMQVTPFALETEWNLKDVGLAPYQDFLSGFPRVSGTLDTTLTVQMTAETASPVQVKGDGVVHDFRLGLPSSPFLTARQVEVSDIQFISPDELIISRLSVDHLALEILRDRQGALPILDAFQRESPTPSPADTDQPRLMPEIGTIQIKNGRIDFIDQSIQPEYQKQLAPITATIKHPVAEPDSKGHMILTASTPEEEIIEMEGGVRLFGGELFLDLNGTVKKWSVVSLNSYAEQWLGWGTRSGQLATEFSIHVEEEMLKSTGKIGISDLRVVRAGAEDLVDRTLGLPLGLIVALIKNIHGDIQLSVHVEGPLNEPEFSLRDAFWRSLRNAVVNIVTSPLRLIGRLATRDDTIKTVDIHPILFQAGTSTMSEGMEERLQHFQEFLNASPYIELTIHPKISAGDLHMLRIRNVASRIAELESQNPSLKGLQAAQTLYRERFPKTSPPQDEATLMKELVGVEPDPLPQAEALAAERATIVVEKLTASPDISPDRLTIADYQVTSGEKDGGRLEFSLTR